MPAITPLPQTNYDPMEFARMKSGIIGAKHAAIGSAVSQGIQQVGAGIQQGIGEYKAAKKQEKIDAQLYGQSQELYEGTKRYLTFLRDSIANSPETKPETLQLLNEQIAKIQPPPDPIKNKGINPEVYKTYCDNMAKANNDLAYVTLANFDLTGSGTEQMKPEERFNLLKGKLFDIFQYGSKAGVNLVPLTDPVLQAARITFLQGKSGQTVQESINKLTGGTSQEQPPAPQPIGQQPEQQEPWKAPQLSEAGQTPQQPEQQEPWKAPQLSEAGQTPQQPTQTPITPIAPAPQGTAPQAPVQPIAPQQRVTREALGQEIGKENIYATMKGDYGIENKPGFATALSEKDYMKTEISETDELGKKLKLELERKKAQNEITDSEFDRIMKQYSKLYEAKDDQDTNLEKVNAQINSLTRYYNVLSKKSNTDAIGKALQELMYDQEAKDAAGLKGNESPETIEYTISKRLADLESEQKAMKTEYSQTEKAYLDFINTYKNIPMMKSIKKSRTPQKKPGVSAAQFDVSK